MVTNLPTGHTQRVTEFLQKQTARGRIAFVIDATASREPTWDTAAQLQAEMFGEVARFGTLEMQVVYFRGTNEVGASNWSSDARELQHFMGRIRCEGGYTKYVRAFERVVGALGQAGQFLKRFTQPKRLAQLKIIAFLKRKQWHA